MGEGVVTSTRVQRLEREVPLALAVIDRSNDENESAFSPPDVLTKTGECHLFMTVFGEPIFRSGD